MARVSAFRQSSGWWLLQEVSNPGAQAHSLSHRECAARRGYSVSDPPWHTSRVGGRPRHVPLAITSPGQSPTLPHLVTQEEANEERAQRRLLWTAPSWHFGLSPRLHSGRSARSGLLAGFTFNPSRT